MKRLALLALLLAAYAAFFGRSIVSRGSERLDPVGPPARQIDRAIAERRFHDAKPIALEVLQTHPREALVAYWFAIIEHGLDHPQEEIHWWEQFIEFGGNGAEACPQIAEAYRRLGDESITLAAFERCASLDPDDPERLIDLAAAYQRRGRHHDALGALRRAAALDPRNPFIAQRIDRLGAATEP